MPVCLKIARYLLNVIPLTCSPTNMRAMSAVLYHAGLPGMVSVMRVPLMTRLRKLMFSMVRSGE